MNDKFPITYNKDVAPFILDAFSDIKKECKFCEKDITHNNLGGVIKLDGKCHFVCSDTTCLIEYNSQLIRTPND